MVPFNQKNMDAFIRNCSWIKVSINAGNPKNYAEVHRTNEKDFNIVMENMKAAVKLKNEKGYKCTLGGQLLLVSDNYDSAAELALRLRDVGFDYLVIKPYSQHLESNTTKYKDLDYSQYLHLEEDLKKYNTDKFKVIFRANTINKLIENKERYAKCSSVPYFWAYVQSDGAVFGCSAFLTNDKFNYGNIHNNTFKEIWEGEKRKESLSYIRNDLCITDCRINCRMDEINRYLWELTHPSEHVNFI